MTQRCSQRHIKNFFPDAGKIDHFTANQEAFLVQRLTTAQEDLKADFMQHKDQEELRYAALQKDIAGKTETTQNELRQEMDFRHNFVPIY